MDLREKKTCLRRAIYCVIHLIKTELIVNKVN